VFNEIYDEGHKSMAEHFTKYLKDLDYGWFYYNESFNLHKIYNFGLDKTESDFVVYSIADTLFVGDWLNPLKALLATGKYHSAQGVCSNNYDGFYTYAESSLKAPGGLLETTEPFGSHFVMRRKDGFRWDEEVGRFYPDVFYREFLRETGQLVAIYAHSHVEHLAAPISNLRTHYDPDWANRELRERLILDKYRNEGWKQFKPKKKD